MSVSINIESPEQPEVLKLLAESDAFYESRYPSESNHLLGLAALKVPEVAFLVARIGGRVVGIGAVVVNISRYAEIKRMYVDPGMRGRGIGRQILDALEQHARSRGLLCLRLETGIEQPEAIKLYRSAGYREVEPFGSYKHDPLSLFMEKVLPPNRPK